MFLVRHIQSWQPQFLHLDIRTQSDLHSCRHGLHKTEMGLLGLASGVPMGIHGERRVTFFAKIWGPAIGDTYYWLRHWYQMIGTFLKALKGTSLYGQTNNSKIFMKNNLNNHDFHKQHVEHVVFNMSWTSFQQVTYLPELSPSPSPNSTWLCPAPNWP